MVCEKLIGGLEMPVPMLCFIGDVFDRHEIYLKRLQLPGQIVGEERCIGLDLHCQVVQFHGFEHIKTPFKL